MKEPHSPEPTDPSEASLEDMKREAAVTREKVQEDISAVVDKVSPAQLKQDVKGALENMGRRAAARILSAARQMAATARANPVIACSALLLIGGAAYAMRKAVARAPRSTLLVMFSAAVVSWRVVARALRPPPLIRPQPRARVRELK